MKATNRDVEESAPAPASASARDAMNAYLTNSISQAFNTFGDGTSSMNKKRSNKTKLQRQTTMVTSPSPDTSSGQDNDQVKDPEKGNGSRNDSAVKSKEHDGDQDQDQDSPINPREVLEQQGGPGTFCCHTLICLLCLLGVILLPIYTYKYTSELVHIESEREHESISAVEYLADDFREQFTVLQEILHSQADAMTSQQHHQELLSSNTDFSERTTGISIDFWEKTAQRVQRLVPSVSILGWAPILNSDQDNKDDIRVPIAQIFPNDDDDYSLRLLQYDLLAKNDLTKGAIWEVLLQDDITSSETTMLLSDMLVLPSNSSKDDDFLFLLRHWAREDATTTTPVGNERHYSFFIQPVYDSYEEATREVKAIIFGLLSWEEFVDNVLGKKEHIYNGNGIDSQQEVEAFVVGLCGTNARHVQFPVSNTTSELNIGAASATVELPSGGSSACHYTLHLQTSSSEAPAAATKLTPTEFTIILAATFAVLGCLLVGYVFRLQWYNFQVHRLALSASNVLASMFPAHVCDRILKEELEKLNHYDDYAGGSGGGAGPQVIPSTETTDSDGHHHHHHHHPDSSNNHALSEPSTEFDLQSTNHSQAMDYDSMIMETVDRTNKYKTKPIADLFPEATVLFADIVGFTAWSSTREPYQVFDLLETIYHTFDEIAKKRHVFKVETVGDCYVAVTGIPVPRPDHAVLMALMARDCLHAMEIVTAQLEVALGPDTSDLSMRFGLHSGPITAGVLRGERSRFQLFGDTVNTAARMESNGLPGRIHISQETANYLNAADKGHWFIHRDGKITAKGKGMLQTYWLDPMAVEVHNQHHDDTYQHPTLLQAANRVEARQRDRDLCQGLINEKEQRLIDWCVDQLYSVLKQIEAKRQIRRGADDDGNDQKGGGVIPQAQFSSAISTVFDEVKEVIQMPEFNSKEAAFQMAVNPESVELHPDVLLQLNDFVTSVSTLYRNNPFHNFEHATHVTLSVTKMLSRIVSGPMTEKLRVSAMGDDSESSFMANGSDAPSDFGLGISSDPLCHFAVIFSALIHDVDHLGVSNAQLVKENSHLARVYKNQSVAEQNSVNIAWDMLMDPAFAELRNCIYRTEEEFIRFRQLVVNAVMATDIVDKDLKALRNAKWEKAFQKKDDEEMTKEDIDRKATIVIEHLIQASDVAHTMQHWQVYLKWNERLFKELYRAYKKGRMDKNPVEFWYQGEIGFFDFYIIPLAKKLRDCGVFGVSCDEYLNYAELNRAEWEKSGMEVLERYKEWTEEVDKEESEMTETA